MRSIPQYAACTLLLGLLLLLARTPTHAQSVGFEVGLAGVENFPAFTPMYGVSGYLDLTNRLDLSASYVHWANEDEGGFFGNQGINVVGLVRLLGSARGTNASLGAGVGFYDMNDPLEEESSWEEAFTMAAMVRQPVSRTANLYFRGDLSTPFRSGNPNWGLFRLGIEARVY